MLRKFVTIKNVGRFSDFGARGDVELKRYNLIFAENGRGKTTLCALLRSLQSGDGAHVLGRSTLGAPDPPEVEIRTNAGTMCFRNGSWSATVPEIAVFDSTFISENVYAGDIVSIGQKRNLYGVIVGKAGVDLAQQIAELDGKSRAKAAEIAEKAAEVRSFAPREMPVDVFIAVDEDAGIAEKIAAKEKELASVKQAAQIKSRGGLHPLSLPNFGRAALEALLGKTVEGIAVDAERLLNEQVANHAMHGRGQAWLSEGLQYIRGNSCPFSNQQLDAAAALIAAYRAFFSAEYNGLRDEIAAMRRKIETDLGDRAVAEIEKTAEHNATAAEF